MRRTVMILVGVLALLASACGGDITEDEFKEQLTEDGLLDDEQAQCIVDGLGEAGISLQSVTDEELGGDRLPDDAQAVVTDCLFSSLGLNDDMVDPALTEEGVGDPTLDALYADCEGGDGQSCDSLFIQSAIGSRYEAFGNSCGNRYEAVPELLCADLDLD